ncbi:MAG: hypothetical protein P8L37_05025 [Phycisphaerales bacterium]|nr:hypothetical protein [Phycisphaerales bacterium]
MPRISARLPGRHVKCPHCWERFFSKSESMFIDESHRRVSPVDVPNWDNPLDASGRPFTMARACPICGLEVSVRLLETNSVFISIVGTPSSGKTYLLAAMYHMAKQQLSGEFRRSISYPGVSGELVARYFDKLFRAGDPDELVSLPKTQEGGFELYSDIMFGGMKFQYPKPFTMRITDPITRDSFAVVSYDNAGESYDQAASLSSKTKSIDHLADCDLIIVVIDPVQIPSLAREMQKRGVKDPQIGRVPTSKQDQMLNGVLERTVGLRGGGERKLLKTPVCVVIQKWDMLKSAGLVPDLKRADPTTGDEVPLFDPNPLNTNSDGGVCVDMEELRAISIVVRHVIDQYEPNIINTMDASFETVRYFAASALGGSPEFNPETNKFYFRPKDVNPSRVTDPLLWFLAREGVLLKSGETKHVERYPEAQLVRRLRDARFQVQSPHDPAVWIDLDSGYFNSKYDSILPDVKSG